MALQVLSTPQAALESHAMEKVMSLSYQVLTCSQDSRYPQDLVITLRFDGEAPDANESICLLDAAPDLLDALQGLLAAYEDPGNTGSTHDAKVLAARNAIAKATA